MGLGLDAEQFSNTYKEGSCDIRMNCYPPCPEPERVMGIDPHIDFNGLTLLLECNDLPGYQVQKDGHWVVIEPIDGAMIVNLGHVMEIMSNGIYKAPYHRVVVNKLKQRLSVGNFSFPNSSVDIGLADKLINACPPLYKNLTHAEYFDTFINRKHGVPFIDQLKI